MKLNNRWMGLGVGALLAIAPACEVTVKDGSGDDDAAESDDDAAESDDDDGATGSDDDDDTGATGDDDDTGASGSDDDTGATGSDDDDDDDTGATSDDDGATSDDDDDDNSDDGKPVDTGDGRWGCGRTSGATTITYDLTADTTWSGRVILDGSITLRGGAELTIEAGTQIIMTADSSFTTSGSAGDVTLLAEGTEEAPIVFCGEKAEAGYWKQIFVGEGLKTNSVLSHVNVFDGGGADATSAIYSLAELEFDHVLVSNAASVGVAAAGFDKDSTALSVTNSAGAVILGGPTAITNFPLGGTFEGNEEQLARIWLSWTEGPVTFHDLGMPYYQNDTLEFREGTVATFEAGVEYRVGRDSILDVGRIADTAEIHVDGTEESPVIFRGSDEEPGAWGGISINKNVLSASSFNHMQLWHAGGDNNYALALNAKVHLSHVSLADNENGLYISAAGLDDDSTDLSVTATESFPVVAHPAALTTLPTSGDLTGNATDEVRVLEGVIDTITGTIPKLSIPYRLEGVISADDSNLTLVPGTLFRMASDAVLNFGRSGQTTTIVAVGTEEEPIRFEGVLPDAGYWQGIWLLDTTSDSALHWVEVADGGASGHSLFLFAPFDLESCTIENYDGVGLSLSRTDATDYAATNTFDGEVSTTHS